jgi:hypothetical protein
MIVNNSTNIQQNKQSPLTAPQIIEHILYGSEMWGTFNHNVNKDLLYFFFFHLMATVNWLTILPLFGCVHKNLNILRCNKVKFIYSASENSVI